MHLHSFQRVFAFLCAVALWARVELAVAAPPAKAPPRDFAGARVGQTRMDNGLKTPLVWIPPGDFTMGSPNDEKGRQHNENQVRVTLTKGFWLGQHVVTQAEWQRVMQTTPWSGKDHVKEGADYPATWVTWFAAIKFCEKLTETERNAGRLPSDWQYTLPTEAQWEYACRAGTKSRYSFGDEESDLANYAWFGKSISDAGENCAQQVGRKRPNPWGLFDMHGNVWEWCLDVYAEKVPGGVDPEVSAGGLYQVSRGGCWDTLADFCRAACRLWDAPGRGDNVLGFRVAAVPCAAAELRSSAAAAGPLAKALLRDFPGTKAGQTRKDNGLGTTLVWIPPGDFTMGSPKGEKDRGDFENQVQVTLTKGFWLGQHEVTQAEWRRVMGKMPWKGAEHVKEGDNYPATYVSWNDAMRFCEKLTEAETRAGRLPADWQYTLPTEAQWEYACRAGSKSRFSFGDDDSQLGNYAWFAPNAIDAGERYAHQVGKKKANAWGLFDMHGNVWEWCRDRYVWELPGGTDPLGQRTDIRVCRGGCWSYPAEFCRSAYRFQAEDDLRLDNIGFRLAVVPAAVLQSKAARADNPEPSVAKPTPPAGPAGAPPAEAPSRDFAGAKAGQTRKDNELKMSLAWIPPGRFIMGSPKNEKNRSENEDQVQVALIKGFWLGQHEVTQSEWQRVMQTTPWSGKKYVKEGDDYPATFVSWDDAMEFCEKLTQTERQAGRLPSDWHYTLPTEAQWEYACRAGTKSRFSFGDDDSKLGDYAWYTMNADETAGMYPHQVGQKKANGYGLFDMHGNVKEWCQDWSAWQLPGGTDPQGPPSTGLSRRVFRGGSWNEPAWNCRSAYRDGNPPEYRIGDVGFRVAAVPSGK